MKNHNMRTIVAALALIATLWAWAGVERPTTLCVENTLGEVMTFALSENPKMTFKGTFVVIQAGEINVLKFKDLTRAYFTEEDPDAVAQAAATQSESVTTDSDIIGFKNFKPLTRVFVYTATGTLAKVAQTDIDGQLHLSVSDLPHGTYVIQAGHSSVKMRK